MKHLDTTHFDWKGKWNLIFVDWDVFHVLCCDNEEDLPRTWDEDTPTWPSDDYDHEGE